MLKFRLPYERVPANEPLSSRDRGALGSRSDEGQWPFFLGMRLNSELQFGPDPVQSIRIIVLKNPSGTGRNIAILAGDGAVGVFAGGDLSLFPGAGTGGAPDGRVYVVNQDNTINRDLGLTGTPANIGIVNTIGISLANARADHIHAIGVLPGVSVRHSVQQSILNDNPIVLSFNTELFDTDTMHDNVTNNSRLTFTKAGKYLLVACIEFVGNATGWRQIRIDYAYNSGANVDTIAVSSTLAISATMGTSLSLSTIVNVAVADYVQLLARHTAGAALNVETSASTASMFAAYRLGD